jgi:hypothetical protein
MASAIPPLSWVLSVPRGVRAELRIVGKEVTKGDLQRLEGAPAPTRTPKIVLGFRGRLTTILTTIGQTIGQPIA